MKIILGVHTGRLLCNVTVKQLINDPPQCWSVVSLLLFTLCDKACILLLNKGRN